MSEPVLLGLDWGTTSFRACLIATDGSVIARREAGAGILQVEKRDFAGTLARHAGDWLEAHPGLPVLASGMITSRQGWVEVPYVACPAGVTALAAALVAHPATPETVVYFAAGMSVEGADGVPDVMRGEETQILGVLASDPEARLLVMPGTHSKWVLVQDGRIERFATFMTGELFAVLRQHSILGRLMSGTAEDPAAFARGVDYGLLAQGEAGGLLRRLFSARTLPLFGELPESGVADYLSGLLLGAEIREALASLGEGADDVRIVGSPALADRYRIALKRAGVGASLADADAAARGQLLLARSAGLIG